MKKLTSLAIVFVLMLAVLPTAQASEYMNVYSLDGRVEVIRIADFNAWHAVGWYSAPVMYVYALDGRSEIILKSDFSKWQAVGWYSAPVVKMCSKDGREIVVAKSDIDAYKRVGWYLGKPTYVYYLNNQKKLIGYDEVGSYLEKGWSTNKSIMDEYTKFIGQFTAFVGSIPDGMGGFYEYTLYDVNRDGLPELIIKTGTCEADTIYIMKGYSSYSNSIEDLGTFGCGHSSLASIPGQPGLLFMWGHMGGEWVKVITLENDTIYEETIVDREVGYYDEYYAPWELYDGAGYLNITKIY